MNPNIDKQEMRSYLLGNLEVDRQAALEERILCDPGVYEELLVSEEELIDQYLGNNLSPSEREQFENHFLITAEREKSLHFGRLLRRYLDSQPAPVSAQEIPVAVRPIETPAPAKNVLPFAGLFGRTAAVAISTAVVAAVGVTLLLCWLSMRITQTFMAQRGLVQPVQVIVTLTPGTLRGYYNGIEHVSVPPRGRVRLEMPVSNPNFHNYKSELFRESDSLRTADELQAEKKDGQHIVPWTIPGEVLSPGDYQVRLKGVLDSGQDEFIDNYNFRVVK